MNIALGYETVREYRPEVDIRKASNVRERNGRVHARRAGLAASLGAATVLLSSCDMESSGMRFGWPVGITPQATDMREFWTWTVIASLVIGVITWGLMFWSMVFHRKKANSPEFPRQTGYNVALEVVYTVIPVLIVAGLFWYSLAPMAKATALKEREDMGVVVDVTAYKWNWKFGYAEVSSEFTKDLTAEEYKAAYLTSKDGKALKDAAGNPISAKVAGSGVKTDENGHAEVTMEDKSFKPGERYFGADGERQQTVMVDDRDIVSVGLEDRQGDEQKSIAGPVHGHSKNDLSNLKFNRIEMLGTSEEVPMLVLPVSTPIEFDLNSADVVHSFWVPEFLFKRDVFPHPERNNSQSRFQIDEIYASALNQTSADGATKYGSYVGRCAEMCGTYHSMMNFEIRVLSKEDFAKYLKLRQEGKNNAKALEALGLPGYTTSTAPFNPDRGGSKTGDNSVGVTDGK